MSTRAVGTASAACRVEGCSWTSEQEYGLLVEQASADEMRNIHERDEHGGYRRPLLTKEEVDAIAEEVIDFAEGWACGEEQMDWEDYIDRAERHLDVDFGSSMDAPGIKRFLAISRKVRKESR